MVAPKHIYIGLLAISFVSGSDQSFARSISELGESRPTSQLGENEGHLRIAIFVGPDCYSTKKNSFQLSGCHCGNPSVDWVCDGTTSFCGPNSNVTRRPPNCQRRSCDDEKCQEFYRLPRGGNKIER
jgi:hypothetical protein